MQKTKARSRLLRLSFWGGVLFWGWNIIFIAFMLFGFAPVLLPDMLIAARGNIIPPTFVAYGIVLVLIPVIADAGRLYWATA